MFLDAGTEHIFVYAKVEEYLQEVRDIFREPDFLLNLETLVRSIPDVEQKIAGRRRLAGLWTQPPAEPKTS